MSLGGGVVGKGVVPIEPDTTGFGAELERGVTKEGDPAATSSGSKVGAAFGKAFMATAAAGLAVAAKSVFAFAGFETGMNEVFTLLPGISGKAMDEMSEQVKDFAVDFTVETSKIIPALSLALGSGIEEAGVFNFLETANKLAVGGAADLEQSVGVLASVLNAYGLDVSEAGRISDVMFATVADGVATIPNLTNALSTVTPVAASLGLQFEDVGAAIAQMTLAGVGEEESATKLNRLLIDLSDSGSKASQAFTDVAGVGFRDFIAGGGNLAEAMTIVDQAAKDSGVGVQEMFGSIAGSGALLLIGQDGAESFADGIDRMAGAAGSTEAAFDTMNQGLARTWADLKIRLEVAMLNIGKAIAPFVQKTIAWVSKHWPTIQKVFLNVFNVIRTAVVFFVDNVLGPLLSGFKATFGWLMDNKEFLIGLAIGLAVGFTAWAVSAAQTAIANFTLAGSTIALLAPFIAIGLAVAAVVGAVIYAYNHFEIFRTVVDAVASFFKDTLWPILQDVFGWLRDNVPPIIQGIIDVFTWLWNNVLSPLVTFLTLPLALAWAAVKLAIDPVKTAVDAIGTAANWVWHEVLEPLLDFFGDAFSIGIAAAVAVVNTLKGPFEAIIGFVVTLIEKTQEVIGWLGKLNPFGGPAFLSGFVYDLIPAGGGGTIPAGGGGTFKVNAHGTGAIVPGPRLAIIGDAIGGEAVLTRPQVHDLATWAGLTANIGTGGASGGGGLGDGDRVTIIVEGTPLTAVVRRHNNELASALTAGRR